MHSDYKVASPSLRAVGNIVTGDDIQTQVVLNCSALPCLLHLLSSAKESIRKEACWTISNITAGNRAQIQVLNDTHTHTHCTSLPRASLAGLRLFVMLRLHPQTFKGVSLFVVSMWGLFLDLRITLILCSFCFFFTSSSAGRNRCKHLSGIDRNPAEGRIPHQEGSSVGDH